jgi:UDP-3-O-[3-hydroxymyristoyl] glucosamine N-acyltransferase
MKITTPQTLASIAQIMGIRYIGPPDLPVTGINEIHRVEHGDITFVDVAKYFKKALSSAASVVVINQEIEAPEGKGLLISEDPFSTYNAIGEHFRPKIELDVVGEPKVGKNVRIGRNVVFGEGVVIGDDVSIGHNCVIGSFVTIGSGTEIFANVTIYDYCELGKEVCLQSGAIIGGEAFYYKKRPDGRDKMLSKGITVLEDYVHIGANATIDRGVSAETRIGYQTKIDNLVQIGHDTIIGKRCVLAAHVGIAGACTIGDDVIIWGQVGMTSGVTIGSNTTLMAKTGVISSLEGGKVYIGIVAKELKKGWRELAALDKLPDLLKLLESYSIPAEKLLDKQTSEKELVEADAAESI